MAARGILTAVRDLLFPPRCCACRTLLDRNGTAEDGTDALCPRCRKEWENERLETCGICAAKIGECTCMPAFLREAKCADHRKLVYYSPRSQKKVQNQIIYSVKHRNHRRTHEFLAAQLLPAVKKICEEDRAAAEQDGKPAPSWVLTYIPRRKKTRADSGTDQARELAAALSRASGIPAEELILRRRAGKEQKKLTPPMRLKNAAEVYFVRPSANLGGKSVLLVDDLVTTGAGMAVCTRLLRRKGAEAIHAVSIATDDCNRDLPAAAFSDKTP